MSVTIYHGTPMTPRAALLDVCKGRAMCVSYFRPDDVEAVEAISPAIMFRQWRVQYVEGRATGGARVGREMGLDRLLRVVGAEAVSSRALGRNPGYARSAFTAQRCAARPVAIRAEGFAPLAHGRANRTALEAVRQVRPGFAWMDGRGQALGQAGVPRTNARGRSGFGQPLACNSHDARDQGGVGLSLHQRGRNNTSSERVAI